MGQIDRDEEILRKALGMLGEEFDSVQVFCTRHDGEGTLNVTRGTGNWFARWGQVVQWVEDERRLAPRIVRMEEET